MILSDSKVLINNANNLGPISFIGSNTFNSKYFKFTINFDFIKGYKTISNLVVEYNINLKRSLNKFYYESGDNDRSNA